MIYLYNDYRDNESYHKIPDTEWRIEECNNELIQECIDKKLNLVEISFDDEFNQSIKTLHKIANLKRITFGWKFNQSIKVLSKCTQLEQIAFDYSFNKSIELRSPATDYFRV
jgi:hypothetical protein